jgi:hypothetical protein
MAMQDLFDSRLGSILRIGRNFSVEGHAVFGKEQMYYNTFFFIEGKIVPSSKILRGIRESIQSNLQEAVQTKYELFDAASSPTLEENYKKAHPGKNLLEAAKKPKVSYTITLDVKKLVPNQF